MSDIADDMAVDEIGPPRGEEPGRWYRRICDLGNGDTSGSIVWIVDRVDPAQLAAQAEDRVPIPAPAIRMTPDASDGSRSAERRVGKDRVRTCRSRGSPY